MKRPLFLAQSVLERLPFRPVRIALLSLIRCDAVPPVTLRRSPADTGMAGPEDLDRLLLCTNKGAKFRRRFLQGDHCIKAEIGGGVAGYLWFSTGGFHREELYGYEIEIPAGAVYCYDEYISPGHRQKGVFTQLYGELADWMRRNNRKSILSLVADGNDLSWKIHMKMGFRPVRRVLLVRVLGFAFAREREIAGART